MNKKLYKRAILIHFKKIFTWFLLKRIVSTKTENIACSVVISVADQLTLILQSIANSEKFRECPFREMNLHQIPNTCKNA